LPRDKEEPHFNQGIDSGALDATVPLVDADDERETRNTKKRATYGLRIPIVHALMPGGARPTPTNFEQAGRPVILDRRNPS
jgi:hypothetical protein